MTTAPDITADATADTTADPVGPGTQASLHMHLVDGIRDIILEGQIPAGAKLPEATLCRTYGVSRTPLREAIKALASEGLVTLRPNRGAVVTPLDAAVLADVFEAKSALEHVIGLHAADRADAADLRALEALHDGLRSLAIRDDPAAYSRLNAAFHDRLAATTPNGQIQQIYAGLQVQIRRARHLVNHDPQRIAASLDEHEGIMAALRIRARHDLAHRLVAHNTATMTAFLSHFRDPDA